jgi:hypothetical protein
VVKIPTLPKDPILNKIPLAFTNLKVLNTPISTDAVTEPDTNLFALIPTTDEPGIFVNPDPLPINDPLNEPVEEPVTEPITDPVKEPVNI